MKTPVYQKIKHYILQEIHHGHWRAGEAIPPEMALSAQFDVSRMTVNRALKELSEEGVLERKRGAGTFVAQRQFADTRIEIRSIASDIRENGQYYQAAVLQQQRIKANAESAQHFDIAMGDELYYLEIVHLADGLPAQLEQRWVNPAVAAQFISLDFTQINSSDWLIQEVPLQRGTYQVCACMPSARIASALQLSPKEPALLLTRQTWSRDQVATRVMMWHPGTRYQIAGTL